MPSWKARISNSPPRRARNSTTTRSVCSPTAIAGNARSRRTSRSTHRTGDEDDSCSRDHASRSPPLLPPPLWGRVGVGGRAVVARLCLIPRPPPPTPPHKGEGSRARRRRMTVAALFFYLFASICVASAVMVIASKNPVHSVLFLILAFVNAAGLFVLMGAEFLAMILVIVYVGAVALLFLSVVMMLDVDFTALRRGVLSYLPVGALIGAVLLVELLIIVGAWVVGPDLAKAITAPIPPPAQVSNTQALGLVLYK